MSPPPNFKCDTKGILTMKISTCYDWFSLTFRHETRIENIIPYEHRLEITKSPIPVYEQAFIAYPHGAKILFSKNERMGKHLILSGKVLQSMRQSGIAAYDLFKHFKSLGGTFSRCDVALDIVDAENMSVDKFLENMSDADTKLSGYKYIASHENVETLYLGNMRSKSRKLRIYNKGIEQGLPILWTRVEYEKRRGADNMMNNMMLNKVSIQSIIKSVVDFPKWQKWQEIIGVDIADTTRGNGIQSSKDWQLRLEWLTESAASALANCMIMEANENINNKDFSLDDSVTLNTFISALNAHLSKKS